MELRLRLLLSVLLATAVALVSGCKGPSAANIKLRKDNQQLRRRVEDLDRRHAADVAHIRALESKATTVPVLPQERVEQLFTVHGIKFGRLTGVSPEGVLKVYVVPTDDAGQQIKAAGSFLVEAFDLAKSSEQQIGKWEFGIEQARQNWFGEALLYEYVLTCPWTTPPQHPDITLKVTFTDALTGRQFNAQTVINVQSVR
jgi:hypothetical protein